MGNVGGIKAGRAFVLIEAVDATGKVLNGVRQKLGKFGTDLSNMGRTMALRAIAALTPAAFAVKIGTGYDDIMRKVEARSEGTAGQMQVLRDQTLKLGKTFGLLPSQIGEAQNIFAQAGFNRGEIASIVPEIAMLARATGDSSNQFENMTQASDAVTAVLRAFHLPAASAAEVANKIGITATASSFGLEGITTSLSHAASAASTYGVSLDEMLSVMSAMKDIQLDDSIVGTAFRNMMGYMSQTDEQEKFNTKLQEMTGNTIKFTDALGNLQGPAKLLPALLKATESMGSAERMNLLFGLLETRAVIPAIAAGSSVERMADIQERLKNWKGANKDMQQHMDGGLGGTFRRFLATLEEIAIRFTNDLAPSLQIATDSIITLTKAAADWITQNKGWAALAVTTAVGMLGLGTALVVVGQVIISTTAILGALSVVTGLVMGSFAILGTMLSVIPAALGLSTAGVFALIAAFVAVPVAIALSADAIKALGDTFKAFGSVVISDWANTIGTIVSSLAAGDLEGAFHTLTAQLSVTWQQMINILMSAWDGFIAYWEKSKVSLANNSWMMEAGAQAAALAAYHTNGGNAKAARQVYDDYKKHFQGTITGMEGDTSGADARDAAARRRDDKLRDLEADRDLIIADQRFKREWEKSEKLLKDMDRAKVSSDERAKKMKADAAGLIGPGAISRMPPKQALEAIDSRSGEAMKQFLDNEFAAYEDRAIEIAEKSEEHLAVIERKIGDLGMGLV